MSKILNGKVAVVTGSGQGVGRAIAIALAKQGAAVITNNRKKGSTGITTHDDFFLERITEEEKKILLKESGDAETVAREIIREGGSAVPFYGDVSDFKVAGELIKTAVDNFGKIDILVNNAGTFRPSFPWEMTEEDWDYVTDNKPKSCFNTIRHALPLMMQQKWGRIINCTSTAWLGQDQHANYSAANAGVVGLTYSVAKDVIKYGITCNAYAPGAMTRATITARIRTGRQNKKQPLTVSDLSNMSAPEQVAPFIVFLSSDEAAGINGTVFLVYGGHIGRYSYPKETAFIDKKGGSWTVEEIINKAPDSLLQGYKYASSR
jgi:3-oxoacyl-[acyl-carrier protein] reductase